MGYPRAATAELLQRIERVCRMRIAADAIPSDWDIACEHGVSERVVARWMSRTRKAILAGGQPDEACTDTAFRVEKAIKRP